MDVDPARPCVFWFTSLYYAATSSAGWSTRIAEVLVPDRAPNCNPLVPSLEGLPLPQAQERLKQANLTVGTVRTLQPPQGSGALSLPLVTGQSLVAGTEANPGAIVDLTLQAIPSSPQ